MAEEERKKYAVLGRAALLVTTLIWGNSFVVLKDTLESVPTLYILAYRFSGAAVLLALVFFKQMKKIDAEDIRHGLVLGSLVYVAYTVQTYGLYYTTPSKNAFLTASYCVIVPFVMWIMDKKRPDKYNFVSTAICLVGVGLVSLKNDRTIALGDALTLCCGIFYAIHIVMTSKYIKGRSVAVLTTLQFAFAGVFAWVSALLTGPYPTNISTQNIWSIVYLSVMCTAVCFLLQTFGQKHTPPATTAIFLTLESVFGAGFSVLMKYEVLTPKLFAGFAVIFSAIIISETKLSFLKRRKTTPAAAESRNGAGERPI